MYIVRGYDRWSEEDYYRSCEDWHGVNSAVRDLCHEFEVHPEAIQVFEAKEIPTTVVVKLEANG